MKYIDLHTHTHYSDGGLSPTDLMKEAKKVLLSAVAVTDHDNVSGLGEARAAGEKLGIEVVSGIELSVDYQDYDLHILGYFIDPKNRELKKQIDLLNEDRIQGAKNLIKNLNEVGYVCDFDQVRKKTVGVIGRPHIAVDVVSSHLNRDKIIADFGEVIKDVQPFFQKYLKKGCPVYDDSKTNFRFEAKKAIDLIHKVGGLAVLAHPAWDLTEVEKGSLEFSKDWIIREFRDFGLDGLEVITFRETQDLTQECIDHFTQLARERDLLITGGSDFHGFGSAGKSLGLKEENMLIEYDLLSRMKARVGVV